MVSSHFVFLLIKLLSNVDVSEKHFSEPLYYNHIAYTIDKYLAVMTSG